MPDDLVIADKTFKSRLIVELDGIAPWRRWSMPSRLRGRRW